MGKRNKVTTRDIAQYTGVSQSTVSMILSEKPHVSFSKETIESVKSAASELGYRKPEKSKLSKDTALSKTIFVMCPILSNGYYSMLIHSITEQARTYGYNVFTISTIRDASLEDFYLNMLSDFELKGIIFLYPPTKIAQANILSKQLPLVSIGDKPEGSRFDAVELDSKKPGQILGNHLISLGHTHITFISAPIRNKEIGRIHRFEGLKKSFKEHGMDTSNLKVKSPSLATYSRYTPDESEYQNGYDLTMKELSKNTASTAFVGNNDMTAFGIMSAIIDAGYRVPYDYSVCGFDNIPLSSMSQISLTTIEHAAALKGREAVDIIYKKNHQKEQKSKHKYTMRLEYEPELIIRKSTGKAKQKNVTNN
ncbi:MAG: LacI family DNA-binding transcriptional regulator [Anaerostipes sp.]|nr:LacI family DNA-binding transcriptional regulator [Anaerostipes sp.]